MRVHEFMTSPALTVTPQTPIREAGELLLERNVTALPVLGEQAMLVGIVSRSDLLRRRVLADPRAHLAPVANDPTEPPATVEEVMTTQVVTVRPTADEAEAAHLMLRHQIKSLPVVEADRLLGIVSVTDILRVKVRADSDIAQHVRHRLRAYTDDESCWDITVHDGVVSIHTSLPEERQRILRLLAETVPGVVRVKTVAGSAARPRRRS